MTDAHPMLEGLNPDQQAAVGFGGGPLLVLAGAGSGKTRVLTRRIAFMLQGGIPGPHRGLMPQEILAVTFTNKAAKEMRERIGHLVGDEIAKALWVGTFHSVCGRILRRDIEHYRSGAGRQWNNRFVIYDTDESQAAIKQVLKAQNLDEKTYQPRMIHSQISQMKNNGLDAYAYGSTATDFKSERLALIMDGYEAVLAENNALDFDDMLLMSVGVLQQNPEVLARYHRQFQHILVDEFQDTNDVQASLVRMLALGTANRTEGDERRSQPGFWHGRSLTVVGDADQSIYSWRGANFRIILNFQKDFPETRVIKLLDNYRSTRNILDVANAIIENNTERLPKDLRSVKGQGQAVTVYEADDDREEAAWIVEQLVQVSRSGAYKPGDCCLLYRTNVQSRLLEEVLMSRGLPYTMIGGLKFYERREIKDVLAYLTVIFNEQDAFSVKRILNVPKRGIGKTTVEKLEQVAQQQGISFYQALRLPDAAGVSAGKTRQALGEFVTVLEALKEDAETIRRVDGLMEQILKRTGYNEALMLEDPTDSEGRLANVEELLNVAKQFHLEQPEGDLADFLTQMALLSDIDSAEPAENRFVLMTLHAAKGLEFPVVGISGLEEGLFPHMRALSAPDQMEEERRLMYVGVTRAMDRLYLSYARRRLVFGELKYSTPSRFLREIPADLLTGSYSLDRSASRSHSSVDQLRRGGRGAGSTTNRSNQPEPYASGISASQRALANNTPAARPTGNSFNATPGSPTKLILPSPSASKSSNTLATKPPQETSSLATPPGSSFAVGDRVVHAKFGVGTVDQVLSSGEKTLYNVQFDRIKGRKLLDPRFAKLDAAE
ncbi:MAG: 3'-5' exonuclease [Candidatus Melainabacteria bacterium]|nr:3'-5' exonuclease [Candidatus Melainabacteria bacterium]